jgi:cytochrome P450
MLTRRLFSTQFGQGSRTCGGRHISLVEMNKVVVEILRRFDVSFPLVDGLKNDFEKKTFNRWFLKFEELPVLFERRRA